MKNIFLLIHFFLFTSSNTSAAPIEQYIRENAIEIAGGFEINPDIVKSMEKYKVIIVGEFHGTDKTPLLVGHLVKAFAKEGPVILALEIEKANQGGLNEFLKTGDKRILELLAHFAAEYKDGRSSQAMADLLNLVRESQNIQVVAFDPDFNFGPQDRDTRMAKNIIEIHNIHPEKRIVILAGNIHAATQVGNTFDPIYRPMGYELAHINDDSPFAPSDIFSILVRHQNATIWACFNDNYRDCGPKKLKEKISVYSEAVPYSSYYLIEPELSPEGYNGTFFIRTVDASPPFCLPE